MFMPLYQLVISGRVQGVAYRYNTLLQAEALGIRGIVKNQADGSVYAEIEGTEAQLQAMIEWCRSGPTLAQVTRVEVTAGAEKNYAGFDIIR